MPTRIFLTGCTGLLGSRLTVILLNYGYEVFGVSGNRSCEIVHPRHQCRKIDLLNSAEKLNIQRIKPDVLVHTAWLTTPKIFWESPENERWLQASKRIIQEFIASGGAYTVVTGSCAEYSWDNSEPLSESSLELPSSTYGKAKLDLLNWIRESETPFLWSRIFFQFGGDEPTGKLIPTVIDSLKNGNLFVIQNASDTRDFVHIEDITSILGILITKKIKGVVNIGRGEGIKIKNVVQSLASILGREDLIQWRNGLNQSTNVVSDPRKLQSLIGTYRWKSFDDSLRELANTTKI